MKYPSDYYRNTHPFLNRLRGVWRILTCRNFILIDFNEFERQGQKGRKVRTLHRTDYNKESELLTIKAVYNQIEKMEL